MAVKVKICGITNEKDAQWAVGLGADFLGLNFYSKSPRKVSPALAARIVATTPPFVTAVGVFVDEDGAGVVKIAQKAGLMGVQLHGEQTPEDCRRIRESLELNILCKAIRVATEDDVDAASAFQHVCTHLLIDARVEGQPGGTGQTFPWALASRAKAFGLPYFVAGGLTPDNVAEAVRQTRPFGVDVASGVEASPKRKDYNKMKAFIAAAKSA